MIQPVSQRRGIGDDVLSFLFGLFRYFLSNGKSSAARCLLLITFCFTSAQQAQADIKDIRVWESPEKTRVVFDLSQPYPYKIFTLSNPDRVVVDIAADKLTKNPADVEIAKTGIKKIRSGKRGDKLRLVFDLVKASRSKSFDLEPNKKYPSHRLVVDIIRTDSKPMPVVRDLPTETRDIIIAIDAGHGGEDPGAIGPKRIKEKHVVLSIARQLAELFEQTEGYKPYLVRDGDYYIGLRQRTAKARAANADFFVSIHADAFKRPSASGSSVYVLSERGATSEAARWLADKENEADLVGGVSLGKHEDHLAMTLLDLSMTHKRNASLNIGGSILDQMGIITKLHKKRVEEAAFVVLKSPDIPALLIETGFISNPGEAKKLADKKHQRKVARAIFRGITKHFNSQPPAGTLLAKKQQTDDQFRSYTVRRGDTLSELAVRNNIALSELRRLNALRSDSLRIGQKLKLPQS